MTTSTINGTVLGCDGTDRVVMITVQSQSTPQVASGSPGVIEINDVLAIRSTASGTFSLTLEPGQYLVMFTPLVASPSQSPTTVTINVALGGQTYNFSDIVTSTTPVIPGPPANTVFNGQWAGNINFLPLAAPAQPTYSEVAFTGGNINANGDERYAYWISFVTATGESAVSPLLQVHDNVSATPNMANRIFVPSAASNVTSIHIWRTYVDTGSGYNASAYPQNVGLLATVTPTTPYYDDYESTADFAARVTATPHPPTFDTTAGGLMINGVRITNIDANGVFYIGSNVRIVPGVGLQVYNFSTSRWYTLLNTGAQGSEAWGMDGGNPN